MSELRDLIDNPHPVYVREAKNWQFFLDSYEGGPAYTQASINTGPTGGTGIKVFAGGKEIRDTKHQSNLFPHAKERDEDYQVRLAMSQYFNFCAPVIDIYTSFVFKEPIVEDWGSLKNDIDTRKENIDRMGSSIYEYRKNVAELVQIYGHCFVLVDHPKSLGEIRNRLDKVEQDNFPYFATVHPQNVINWALDRFGAPYWVLIREADNLNIDPFSFDKEKVDAVNYRLWTRTEWVLMNGEGKEIERGTHGLGVVPIATVFGKRSKREKNFLGISDLTDIAFITRDIYNSVSELRQILRDQTFAFLALQGSSDEYKELSVGTNKALIYPEDRNQPAYISPPKENADAYMQHIDNQIRRIYQLAKLDGGSAKQEKQVAQASGVSKAFDFLETNTALAGKAENFQDGEIRAWGMYAKWLGKDEFDGSLTYPDDFDIESLNGEIERALKTKNLEIGDEYRKQVNIAIVKKQFPRMDEDELNKILDDIENNTGNEETQGGALLRRMGFRTKQNDNPGVNRGPGGLKDAKNDKPFNKNAK